MYQKIKQLADEAIALQNKDRMDAVLREIRIICETGGEVRGMEAFVDARTEQAASAVFTDSTPSTPNDNPVVGVSGEPLKVVVEELMIGKTVLIDGKFVKLASGDLPEQFPTPAKKGRAK